MEMGKQDVTDLNASSKMSGGVSANCQFTYFLTKIKEKDI